MIAVGRVVVAETDFRTGAYCPVFSMVRASYVGNIGDVPFRGRSRSIDCAWYVAPCDDTPTPYYQRE